MRHARAVYAAAAFALLTIPTLGRAASALTVTPTTSYDGNFVARWTDSTVWFFGGIVTVYLATTADGVTWSKTNVTGKTSLSFSRTPGSYSAKVQFYEKDVETGRQILRDTSNVVPIVAASPPRAFALSSPAAGATGITSGVTLDWSDSQYASSYQVSISTPGSTSPSFTTATAQSVLAVPAGALQPGATYAWQVTATNAYGAVLASNGPFTFTTAGGPGVALDWSRPPRYGELLGGITVQRSPYDPMDVILDACGSTAGFWPIATYTFATTVPGSVPVTQASCTYRLSAGAGASFTATVTATDAGGQARSASAAVTVVDYLVVAVGDSYASGEGNPDVPIAQGGPLWEDASCHRSHFSPGGFAAAELEGRDSKSTVTFVSAACSGDTTADVQGAQLAQIAARLAPPPGRAPRQVDLFVVGVGGNDMDFASAVTICIVGGGTGASCVNDFDIERFIGEGKRDLPARLDATFAAIRGMTAHVGPATKIVLTEYPDPTRRSLYDPCEMVNFGDPFAIWPSESSYLSKEFGTTLNEIVLSAAARNHVAYTAGVWDASIPHGYCSGAPWVNTYDVSISKQGCDSVSLSLDLVVWNETICLPKGTLHPSEPGAQAIGTAITRAWDGPSPNAVFDSIIRAPVCSAIGSACAAGPALLGGAGAAEPNAPNGLLDGIDRPVAGGPTVESLSVRTVDGTSFAPGKRVTVRVEVMAGPGTRVELYETGRALEGGRYRGAAWTTLGTFQPLASGSNVFTAEYVLPQGALHGVRAWASDPTSGAFDIDALAFATSGEDSCPGTWLKCGDSCTNNDDVNNCGACGHVCPSPGWQGGTACWGGECHPYCTEPGFEIKGTKCEPIGVAP